MKSHYVQSYILARLSKMFSQKILLPVQTVDHVSHSVDEILVFLGVTNNDAVELLHVGVNGFQRGHLSAACGTTSVWC